MTLPALDRAVATDRPAQIAPLEETYVPKTGQTGQTGHCIESAWKFDAPPGQKLTRRDPKLASADKKTRGGTVQQPPPCERGFSRRVRFERARPSDGAPQP